MNEVRCAGGGMMLEVYKDPGWGQINVRTIPPGATAGGHRHPRTNEVWTLLRGRLRVRLSDEPFEVEMKEGDSLAVRAGCGHAVENVGGGEAVLLFWRDRLYDAENPDKKPWVPA